MRVSPSERHARPRSTSILCALLLALLPAATRADAPAFTRFGIEDGLSQATVTAVVQDGLGFVWIGTQDGLDRFDGHDIHAWNAAPGVAGELQDDSINDLLVDRDGTLWVATYEGVSRYDVARDAFTTLQHDPDDPGSLPHDSVSALALAPDGGIWVGTRAGLARIDPDSGAIRTWASQWRGSVRDLVVGPDGQPWLATDSGLHRLDPDTGQVILDAATGAPYLTGAPVWSLALEGSGRLWVGTEQEGLIELAADGSTARRVPSLPSPWVRALLLTADGALWIGTAEGLVRLDPETRRREQWRNDATDPSSLAQNPVISLGESRGGLVWIGTATMGLNMHDPRTRRFRQYRRQTAEPGTLTDTVVYEITGDPSGRLWVGTRNGGLNRLDPATGTFTHVDYRPDATDQDHPWIVAIDAGADGTLWIATHSRGLHAWHPDTGAHRHWRHDPERPDSIASDRLRDVLVDADGSVWIATSGAGLDRLDPATGRVTHHRPVEGDARSLPSVWVRSLYLDDRGELWIGTYGNGAARWHPDAQDFTRHLHDPEDPRTLSSRFVRSIFRDRAGAVWFSTDDGLSRLDGDGFTRFGTDAGLPEGVVYGVLQSDDGALWGSTNHGLVRLPAGADRFQRIDADDGLRAREFNTGAFHHAADGTLWFGGVDGLTGFDPDPVRTVADTRADADSGTGAQTDAQADGHSEVDTHAGVEVDAATVVLTGYRIFNRPVAVNPQGPLREHIAVADRITVAPDQRMITFDFAALSFRPEAISGYRYRLAGFADQWVDTGVDAGIATFTTLSPGDYVFEVAAIDDDGMPGPTTRLPVQVQPRYWETVWFRSLLALLAVAVILLGARARQRHLVRQNRLLEETVAQRTAELSSTVARLQASKQEVSRLEGILPICSGCKRIREEGADPRLDESWIDVDRYLRHRMDADFSHGACPRCIDALYPER